MKRTGFLYDPRYLLHDTGPYHPERAERLEAIHQGIKDAGLLGYLTKVPSRLVDMKWVQTIHSMEYIRRFEELCLGGRRTLDCEDNQMCRDTYETAQLAAGGVLEAARMLMNNEVDNAFCAVRPPGHHAERGEAMGFCYFNNVAIAARYLQLEYKIERVGIIDFDVHHGNGTEDIFADDEHVLMVSTFQHPFYPYSGTDDPAANMVNVPLAAGTGSDGFRAAVEKFWMPALEAFRPEMVFFSAGFDAHIEDDMAMLRLIDSDYAWVTAQVKSVVDRTGSGRIVSMLEGGYALAALGRSVVQHVKVLGGL